MDLSEFSFVRFALELSLDMVDSFCRSQWSIILIFWLNQIDTVSTRLQVDCAYYWFHRMAHGKSSRKSFFKPSLLIIASEVAIMWSFHQMHHSSEDYNLSTALRQSVLQTYSSFVSHQHSPIWFSSALAVINLQLFYLPLALFVPPSIFLAHTYLNLLYQFWIHTEVFISMLVS